MHQAWLWWAGAAPFSTALLALGQVAQVLANTSTARDPPLQALDRSIRQLCAADAALMRRWREGAWQAQGLISDSLLAARQPLQQLGKQLVEAMQQELEAFRAAPWPGKAGCAKRQEAVAGSVQEAALRWVRGAEMQSSLPGMQAIAAPNILLHPPNK